MATVNGLRRPQNYDPPPSSILASRIVQADDTLELNQASFNQLLAESLGNDESGHPNLGPDSSVNLKVIEIVLKAGIDPTLRDNVENPFRTNGVQAKTNAHFLTCLEVVRTAIERSPEVLFTNTSITGKREDGIEQPLYFVVIPRLFSALTPQTSPECLAAIADTFLCCIQQGGLSALTNSQHNPVLDLALACVNALLQAGNDVQKAKKGELLRFADAAFVQHLWRFGSTSHGVASRFIFTSIDHLYFSILRVLEALLPGSWSALRSAQIRKTLQRVQDAMDDLADEPPSTQALVRLMEAFNRSTLLEMGPKVTGYLVEEDTAWPESERARKRPRLSDVHVEGLQAKSTRQQLCNKLTARLTKSPVNDLDGLQSTAPAALKNADEERLCSVFGLMASTVCQMSQDSLADTPCEACDSEAIRKGIADASATELLATLVALLPRIARKSRARVVALSMLRRILLHSNSLSDLNLRDSPAGKWCLQSLRSSTRDIRIAATMALQVYMMDIPADSALTRDNRVVALDVLYALWSANDTAMQETAVLALTRMAEVSGEEEQNLVLLRLVEYLSHRNSYISGLVYEEIQRLAATRQVSTLTLLRPFWRTIGLVIAKNMSTKPVITEQICALSGMQSNALLLTIEEYALPYLVLNAEHAVIEQFAAAHGSSTTTFDVCTAPKTLAGILCLLLTQGYSDPEQKIMEVLLAVSDDFASLDLPGWLNHDPIQVACTLLKSIGEAGEGKTSRTFQALQFLALMLMRKPGQHLSSSKRSETLSTFLEMHALAIVTHFTVLLNDIEAKEPKLEKKRSIAALGELVRIGKSRVAKALPQICACLRSSLDDPELRDVAFSSWSNIILSLKEEYIQPLIDQTLVIIVKHWENLSSITQKQAHDLVADLFKAHPDLIRENFETMPSLSNVAVLNKFDSELNVLKRQLNERRILSAYARRIQDENEMVVEQALHELSPLLRSKHEFLQQSILREKPESFVASLTRALLDSCIRFPANNEISRLCAHALGSIGCFDSNRIETTIERKPLLIPSNFSSALETVDFAMFFLENVLVKTFLSASTTRSQGFLAWAMQELINLCKEAEQTAPRVRSGADSAYRRWNDLPEAVRNTLAPFETSKYRVQEARPPNAIAYPYFTPEMTYKDWLRGVVSDFLHRAEGYNVQLIYSICSRIILGQDLSIPSFLLPYTVLSLIVGGIVKDTKDVVTEMLNVLGQSLDGQDQKKQDYIKSASQSIFEVVQYLSRYLQARKKLFTAHTSKNDRAANDVVMQAVQQQIKAVEGVLESIPPEVISRRAIECGSYARALFHWEQYIRKSGTPQSLDSDYARLQEIYAQIDEPDGIEGISSRMHLVGVEGRVLEHKKAGRWTTAQGWYQMKIVEHPEDIDLQKNLMECLMESGQHHLLLDRYEALADGSQVPLGQLKPYAIESAWSTCRWDALSKLVSSGSGDDFTTMLGKTMVSYHQDDPTSCSDLIEKIYRLSAHQLTPSSITSLENSHDVLLKMHAIDDLRLILATTPEEKKTTLGILPTRLDIMGSNVRDKQYILSVRRAAMQVNKSTFNDLDIAATWLTTARLARKSQSPAQAFDAVLAAAALGEQSASIEEAKLIWQGGQHRKAIRTLEGAISSGAFIAHNYVAEDGPGPVVTLTTEQKEAYQNQMTAKAYLLLGKWQDRAGQSQSEDIKNTFRECTKNYRGWEKGWYYLGRHYNRLLDSEKAMPPEKQSQTFLNGELHKLTIDNYFKALMTGSKFVFQSLPKVLTLWFELVASADLPADPRRGNEKFLQHSVAQKKRIIEDTNKYIDRYIDNKIQASLLYTILPQVVARICHTNQAVYAILVKIVVKVVRAFPNQALWTLLAVAKSQSKDRASRGLTIIQKVLEAQKKSPGGMTPAELRNMISAGQRFSDEVLRVSEFPIESKISRVALAKDLGFNHKIAPSRLVLPVEACLTPSIPTSNEATTSRAFRAFDKEPITISAFLDEALVLSSLQKPRKLTIRGSDGQHYSVLAKPKDDLRKDQRLMEFSTMINRFLKRDVDASKRRLYIRTYAVTPLNEECGLIEWVNNLKTFRDIILKLYKDKSVQINYTEIRQILDQACSGSDENSASFTNRLLATFPPVFHEWFVESFPDPSAWFAARLRYTRSCAVMSIVGHVLGLGDRHGENILFEEDNGSLMHVDFNCLFDKGLTFEKPEHVPFRLTHNMVDAMGPHGYEGPWRRCSEITLTLLRNNVDALMTILETFLHDPTTDFLEKERRRKKAVPGVPNSPVEVLESVRGKVRGYLEGESVPLGVGGYVQEMVVRATDEWRLCRMYIGWCAFF